LPWASKENAGIAGADPLKRKVRWPRGCGKAVGIYRIPEKEESRRFDSKALGTNMASRRKGAFFPKPKLLKMSEQYLTFARASRRLS
jgi:hypothetical protein